MTEFQPRLHGLVPPGLQPKTRRMMLEDFELPLDIGFHDFEIGNPQRLLVTIEVWLDEASFADSDHVERAWNYDRSEEHTSELQSLMRISYAGFCLKKKNTKIHT